MELKPVFLDCVCEPDISKVEDKFGPIVLQVLPKIRLQNNTSLRMNLADGKSQLNGLYVRAEGISEDFFKEGQLIELKQYQMLLSNGRPYIYFSEFEPRGVAPIGSYEKVNASMFTSIRESKGLDPNGAGTAPDSKAAVAKPATEAAPTTNGGADVPKGITTIMNISPYSDTWKILARCTQKSAIREYQKNDRSGKLFSAVFVDETGEIKATAFTEEVDKYYDVLRDNQIYTLSNLKVNPNNNKQFNNTNHDFELLFSRDSVVTPVADSAAASNLPTIKYRFVPLNELAKIGNNSTADVVGIIYSVGESSRFTARSGQVFDKRSVSLVDKTNVSVDVTLWGNEAQTFTGREGEVLAIKGARVGEFRNAKTLSVQRNSLLALSPEGPEALQLKAWYDAGGSKASFNDLAAVNENGDEKESKGMDIEFIRDALSHGDNDYFNVRATVTSVLNRTLYYPSCTQPNCLKKVIQHTDGEWECASCDKRMDKPKYRYVLNIILADGLPSAGGMRVSVFDEIGKSLLECEADEVASVREREGEGTNEEKEILRRPVGKEFLFRIQSKEEEYQGESRLRYRCLRAYPIYWDKATQELLKDLE